MRDLGKLIMFGVMEVVSPHHTDLFVEYYTFVYGSNWPVCVTR
jgi:hypothetical protein